ncbi:MULTISPECIES: hypothetical protein [Peptoniphilus]|uniref:hypothetical protein n=1 Tax=Peptoniphilus TaxID=162289 RepID=UPI0008D956A0|nr:MULTISPECIES: hypothetical protein [Peptoniphilus]MDU1043874.1 hypothetical protein [Peptoniphilus rhinitidis]MDU5275469.1 hypothetical protein [Peptoniphilus lacydonensis]MDU5377696.1 hypothetical protein [Peptoniphilus lacydonensis]MDU5437368.1 hypothetical protein [Peptoniphilus lacydonensis]
MKSKNIIKGIYLLILIFAIFKLFNLNISNYEQFYELSNYEIKKRQLNQIEWEDIGKKDGIYLLTSKDCPYCLHYISNGIELVKKESEEHDLSKNVIDLDIGDYFNNADLNRTLDYYSINTIPCILEIKENKIRLIEFEDIQKF